jgi:hypothetical protein
MYHDNPLIDEQCMKKEKLSSNTFYWLSKSKGSKECVDLPYYEGITVSYIIVIHILLVIKMDLIVGI